MVIGTIGFYYDIVYINSKILKLILTIVSAILITGLYALLCYLFRIRISFIMKILNTSLLSVKSHPLILFLNLISTLCGTIINSIIVVSVFGIAVKYENMENPVELDGVNITEILIISYLLFSYHFNNEIIKNIIHVTISGTTAFFLKHNNEINHQIAESFKRAIYNRFGSICLGSLLNTFIRITETILNISTFLCVPIMWIWKFVFCRFIRFIKLSFCCCFSCCFENFYTDDEKNEEGCSYTYGCRYRGIGCNCYGWCLSIGWNLGMLYLYIMIVLFIFFFYMPVASMNALLSILEYLVLFFNDYTFSLIGIYWKSYKKSSKVTSNIVYEFGFDALCTETLIRTVLIVSKYVVLSISLIISYLLIRIANIDNSTRVVYMTGLFFICRKIFSSFTSGIHSTAITVFAYIVGCVKDKEKNNH